MKKPGRFVQDAVDALALRSKTLSVVRQKGINAISRLAERHNLPAWGWGAKGFEFWTFLSLLLMRSNPSSILELGTGRSTVVFAEYAALRSARFTSIETNRKWYNKARMEFRWQSLPLDAVNLVKLDPAVAWYDVEQFRSIVAGLSFDFVLIDAPNEIAGSSRGFRNSATAVAEIGRCIADVEVVIVDDVHRRHVLDSVDRMLSDPERYTKYYYDYQVREYPNALCLCVKRDSRTAADLPGLAELLGLRLYSDYPRDQCPED